MGEGFQVRTSVEEPGGHYLTAEQAVAGALVRVRQTGWIRSVFFDEKASPYLRYHHRIARADDVEREGFVGYVQL